MISTRLSVLRAHFIPAFFSSENLNLAFSCKLFYSYKRYIWTRLILSVAIDVKSSKQTFMVPFERDSQFVGRMDIIGELDQMLNSQRRVALAGIGGIG